MKTKRNYNRDYRNSKIMEVYVKNHLQKLLNIETETNESKYYEELKQWDIVIKDSNPIYIECKRDEKCHDTKNIAVEYSFKGYESGITSSTSQLWIYKIDVWDEYLVMNANHLRKIINNVEYFWKGMGGDFNNSGLYLFKNEVIKNISVPLHSLKTIEQFKKLVDKPIEQYNPKAFTQRGISKMMSCMNLT